MPKREPQSVDDEDDGQADLLGQRAGAGMCEDGRSQHLVRKRSSMPSGNVPVWRYVEAQKIWQKHCGFVDLGRFRMRIKPLLLDGVRLAAFGRAVQAYADHQKAKSGPMKVEWFLESYQAWAEAGNRSAGEYDPRFLVCAGIANVPQYLENYRLSQEEADEVTEILTQKQAERGE